MRQWKQVVVGVDGFEHSKRALRWASEEASKHGAELRVVSTWTPPPAPAFAVNPPMEAVTNHLADTEAMLQRTLSDTLGDSPKVHVNANVVQGQAAHLSRKRVPMAQSTILSSGPINSSDTLTRGNPARQHARRGQNRLADRGNNYDTRPLPRSSQRGHASAC
jgi:nucleotide-binding universal stress UspA family protein